MCRRIGNIIFLYLTISVIAVCNAQQKLDSSEFNKPMGDDERFLKLQENIEALMKQVGDMGMLLENYRRVIVSGIMESSDICSFIERLSGPDESNDKAIEKRLSSGDGNDMSINLYKQFFRDINDATLKTQIFAVLENHVDQCYNDASAPRQYAFKRDKSNMQKVRFHSWGGKRNRGPQKIVIRTPFHAWGGKRSEMSDELE